MTRIIERLFGTVIHRHERRLVGLMTLDLFVLLAVYYVLKVVRDPLILIEGGVVGRNAARGVQAVILLIGIPLYGALADRIGPRRLVIGVFTFFLATLTLFPLLALLGIPIGFAFFVWLGIFSVSVIAQFWSLANDLFSEEAGKRLFAVIAAGGTLGAVAGARLVALLAHWLDPMPLIGIAAVLLAGCVALTERVRHEGASRPPAPILDEQEERRGGFSLVLHDRYLILIALVVLMSNLINTSGDQILAMIVDGHANNLAKADRARYLMIFYADFQTWTSILTGLLQVFAVARVVRWVGVRFAVLVLPMIALSGYGALAVMPTLMLSRTLKVVENSVDYSVQNTIQQMLFLPTSHAVKYKAKAAIDTFFVRFGDLLSWASVTIALARNWGPRNLALVNTVVACVWIGVAVLLGRAHHRLVHETRSAEPEPARRPEGYLGVTA